jgi:hypothetical protein
MRPPNLSQHLTRPSTIWPPAKAGALALLEEMRFARRQRSNPTLTTNVGADTGAAARALSASIGSRDAEQITKQMAKVGLACASCHEQFRKGGNEAVGAVSP